MPASERSRGGQAEMDGFYGLGLKTILVVGFPVSAAKPGADLARSKSGRRARGVISELASRRREVVEEPCPFDTSIKIWTILPLHGAFSMINSLGVV